MSPTLVIYLLFPALLMDGMSFAKEMLELPYNHTSDIVREDDERFQDQENDIQHPHMNCNIEYLESIPLLFCRNEFDDSMMNISSEHWCDMDYIISSYNNLVMCMEVSCELVNCYYPNPSVHYVFSNIHATYFQKCPEVEHFFLRDAPYTLVVILTLIPVSLIPVLVLLVVGKSKV